MTAEQKEAIEEGHGRWELAAARALGLSKALTCVHPSWVGELGHLLIQAHDDERGAYRHWEKVSRAATSAPLDPIHPTDPSKVWAPAGFWLDRVEEKHHG